MRTAIAAGFAAVVVVAAAVIGWQAVSDRLEDDESTPAEPFDAIEAAIEAGPEGDHSGVVRSGGDELAAAVDAFDRGLTISSWTADRGPIAIDEATATAPLSVTLATEEVGEVAWEAELTATRVRGEWGVDATAETFHPDFRAGRQVVVERTDVTRAPIVDRDGQALTSHGVSHAIGVVPERIVNEDRLLETWVAVLPDSLEDLQELLARSDLHADWYYPIVTVSQGRYEDVWPQLRTVPGVVARDAEDASPSSRGLAQHLLGRVGQPTAEQAQALGVPADAVVGLTGLERAFEDQLVGSAEARALIVDGDGDEVTELGSSQDDPSGPVATTLDRLVQEAVDNALSGTDTEAAVVVLDTTDSAIRASASRPLAGYNRAWEGNYPPGDAFLPVTAEALLAGDVALDDAVACPERQAVVGAAFDAPRPLGETTVGQALAAGCDTALALLARELDVDDLVAAGERFGFGAAFDLPLAVATSDLPPPVDATELVRAAVGRARVLASPLHVASIHAAAASGAWHAPYLLRDQDVQRPTEELAPEAVEDLQRLFELGATEPGSAAGLDALGAGGFVGTAPVTGGQDEHAWAVGVVTGRDDEQLAFAVLVEDTGGDPAPARQLAERFLQELAALRG